MADQRWRRINEIFDSAVAEENRSGRDRLLDEACGTDSTLRAEVESLLAAHERNGGFLEEDSAAEAGRILERQLQSSRLDQQVGPWKIESIIHHGGMGTVYKARRMAHDFEQVGAVKLIRVGLDDPAYAERFARERQILAHLEHPNIARLLDGGTTAEGVPWLVMEFVPGVQIDQWCDARRATVEQRIELFSTVCGAVHAAHQRLVVHRDLKPSNILVSDQGVVKLLDFGIATLLSDVTGAEGLTRTQHRLITPGYASPEQFSGGPITTASDVYSLGVLLYELLTGDRPYETDATISAVELERVICREMPTRPSQRFLPSHGSDTHESRAHERASRPERLRRRLAGDLDTIVMKALRKEPERRYASALELAEDLEHFRKGLPVGARPDTLAYRSRKFVRRHWKALAVAAAAFVAMAAGLGVALWQTGEARAERDRAQQINEFLQTILIEADPYEAGADATVRDVLRKASEMVGERFGNRPALEATLRQTIGYTQLGLMELEESLANIGRADELNHRLYGRDDQRSLETRANLAWIAFRQGRLEEAAGGYQAVIDRLDPGHSAEFRATVSNELGVILIDMERYQESIPLFEEALDLWLRMDPERPAVDRIHNNLGNAWHGLGDLERAEHHYQLGLAGQRRKSPDGLDPNLAINLNNLAILLRDLGRPEEALAMFREALEIRRATLGEEHAFTGFGHLTLGRLLLDMELTDEARHHLEAALRISRETLGPEQLQTLVARSSHARVLSLDGKHAEAARELGEVLEAMRAAGVPAQFIDQAEGWLGEIGLAHDDQGPGP